MSNHTYNWVTSTWSPCEADGTTTRKVWCQEGTGIVPNEDCDQSTKPDDLAGCEYEWAVEEWTNCTEDGRKTRIVNCDEVLSLLNDTKISFKVNSVYCPNPMPKNWESCTTDRGGSSTGILAILVVLVVSFIILSFSGFFFAKKKCMARKDPLLVESEQYRMMEEE